MGEAWFMGSERRMFLQLAGDLAQVSTSDLQEALTEIASGTSCFGSMREWSDWYHYLLPALVPRCHQAVTESVLEYLITAFIALYPAGVDHEPYRGFRGDALLTLGRMMMDAHCWDGDDIRVGSMLHRSNNNPNRIWCWWDASGDFSASMFFCLKYLEPAQVAPWFESVLAIRSPHWRAQVLVWLLGAHGMLTSDIRWPSDWPVEHALAVSWAWSHCLRVELLDQSRTAKLAGAHFIPHSAAEQILAAAQRYFTEDRYLEWLNSFDRVPEVRDELSELPKDFEALYVGCQRAGPTARSA
jgi:hypothetical protein